VVALHDAETVFAGRVLDGDLLALRVRVRVRAGPAAVRTDRLALPQTVVGRERVLEPAVLLQRLFVHQYHRQLFAVAARRLVAAIVVGRSAEARGRRRRENAGQRQHARRLRVKNDVSHLPLVTAHRVFNRHCDKRESNY